MHFSSIRSELQQRSSLKVEHAESMEQYQELQQVISACLDQHNDQRAAVLRLVDHQVACNLPTVI